MRAATLSLVLLPALLVAGCSSPPSKEEQALADIRDTTIIPNLGSYDEQVQKEAVARLLNILESAPEVGKNILAAALRDPVTDDRTKVVCAWLLSTVSDRRALPVLMGYLGQGTDSSESLVREAVVSFGASVVPAVVQVLEEGNDLARIAAAEVLLDLETREGLDALAERLGREPESRVRFLIICGLAADARADSVTLLESALADEDAMNRELAWDALVRRLEIPRSVVFDPYASTEERRGQVEAFREWHLRTGR